MRRRDLLAALPALPLAASQPAAAIGPEHPWDRARRLAAELSDALADIRGAEIASSICVAVVHPSGQPYPVFFCDEDGYAEGWRIARQFIRQM